MKRNRTILLAGAFGLAAVIGFLALRNLLVDDDYDSHYDDFHNLFGQNNSEDQHGIEYFAMQ